ncbi:MAG: MFS transporter [Patescibacteria group bacterium]|nr:MFS transporter [Patescibacteria group bacterium]
MKKQKIPKNVFILSIVSFFNDIASEMVYPIVPIFLTSVLKTSTSIVGLIEGIAEATAAITKFLFGYWSDKIKKRKPFVILGYTFSSFSKGLIALAYFWPLVLFSRFLDRLGKGLRTASRDALLLQNTNEKNKGFIFGFHRSFDSAGAVLGPILGLILIYFFANNLRLIFYLAMIPGLIGVLLLILFVKEKKVQINKKTEKIDFSLKNLDKKIKFFIIVSVIFALGNSSDAFLILRAKNLGLTTQLSILAYVMYSLVQTIFSVYLGKLSDKIGHKRMFSFGLLIFSLVYFSFGFIKNSLYLWFLFPLYGLYISTTDGVSKAYLAEFIKEKQAGSIFGLYQMIIAFATFFASWFGGILWAKISPSATFYFGALMSLLAFLMLSAGKIKYKI